MSDTAQAQATQAVPDTSWGEFKSFDEANREYRLLEEDSGYVLRIDKVDDPSFSPFVDLDEKGKEKPRAIQTKILFTVVDYQLDDPDPTKTVIGQTITQYFRISMHTKSNFYKLVKAAFGGNVDPTWRPNKTELEGLLISATVGHKDPNSDGRVYPKLAIATPYRGKSTYDHVPAVLPGTLVDDEEVPF